MMEKKSLKDISWQVDEPTYRADPALSQSTLTSYERGGFEKLDTLFEKVESPSLTFGSMVDTLITDSEKAFQDNYFVSDIPSLEPSVEPIIKEVFNRFHNSYTNINDILDSELMPIIAQFEYQSRWKPETKCKVIKEKGANYYQTMFMAGDKIVVPQETYNRVFACVRALKDSPQTHDYFCEDNPFDSIERCYQLKFKNTFGGVDYKGMLDSCLVNHEKKVVIPIDLKTSSGREYDFYEHFIKWGYQCQARLYWRLLRAAMDADEYFKDFKLADYRFIVVNSIDNPNPLVWLFDKTTAVGELNIGGNKMRDPEVIGKELYQYLQERPSVPNGINVTGLNNITQWLEKKTL